MIVVYGVREHLGPIRKQLSDTIHHCMQAVLGFPEDKRAHRFVIPDAESVLVPGGRSDRYTVVEINGMSGRRTETNKALIKALFEVIHRRHSISPMDVEITICEQPAHCRGFRGMTGDEATDLKYRIDAQVLGRGFAGTSRRMRAARLRKPAA